MTTFRGVAPLDQADPRYDEGFRYMVATADVTIPPAALTAINAALGGAATPAAVTQTAWSPTDKVSAVVLSGSNRVATLIASGPNQHVRSATGYTTGDLYFEMVWTTIGSAHVANFIGLSQQNAGNASTGADSVRIGYDGAVTYGPLGGSGGGGFGSAMVNGDRIDIAIKVATRRVWIRRNGGAWLGGGDPAANTSPTVIYTNNITVCLHAHYPDAQGLSKVVTVPEFPLGTVPTGFTSASAVTLNSVVFTAAKTLAEGEAVSDVLDTQSPGSAESVAFLPVVRGRTDGFRMCTFDKSLTPALAPGALDFHFVHFGLVGDVFIPNQSEEIDDGPLTGPGGLQARYYSGRDFLGLPVQEPVENVDLQRSESISGVNMNNFSARWVGYIRPPATGNYRFRYTSDGRGRVILGDQTYIDGWGGNSRRVQIGPVKALTINVDVFIRVDVENPELGWEAVLEWETPSTPGVFTVVPASVMFYGANVAISPQRLEGAKHYVQSVNRYEEA